VHVAEVGYGPATGVVVHGDERLALAASLRADVAPDLVISALIAVLGDEPMIDLSRGGPPLARGLFIGREDLIDRGIEGTELGCGRWSGPSLGFGLRVLEGLVNRASCVMKGFGRSLRDSCRRGTPFGSARNRPL
jgi:hypothetical protein